MNLASPLSLAVAALRAVPRVLYGAGAVLLIVAWAAVAWGRAWLADARRRWERNRHQAATQELIAALSADTGSQTAGALAPLAQWSRYEVVTRVAGVISGADLDALRHLATVDGVVDHARTQLHHRRWDHRLRGVALLSSLAIADEAIASLLADRDPVVRAATVRWIARLDEVMDHFPALLERLDDDDGVVRLVVRDTFTGAGVAVVPSLVAALTAEPSQRQLLGLLDIARRVHSPELQRATEPFIHHTTLDVVVAAVRLLGQHLDPAAELVRLAGHDAPQVRSAAIEAAADRGDPRFAGWVGRLATDPDWRVGRAAVHALGRLGAPGELIIRDLARDRLRPPAGGAVAA